MTHTYFVTGTDTDVGKTVCSTALLQAANQLGKSTLAYKPIAAGCDETKEGLRNQDALILQKNSSIKVDYQMVNPIAFKDPIAPHIAAEVAQQPIQLNIISDGLRALQKKSSSLLIVEGAGGWLLPVNDEVLFSDWVVEQQLPVILVVGMKLGCLNHALLSYQTIINSGLQVAGWIANQIQPEMPFYQQNLTLLKTKITAPMIAEIPFLTEIENASLSSFVDIKKLIS